jgi:hypothetical protein
VSCRDKWTSTLVPDAQSRLENRDQSPLATGTKGMFCTSTLPKVKNISCSVCDVSGQDKVRIKPFCLGDITFAIMLFSIADFIYVLDSIFVTKENVIKYYVICAYRSIIYFHAGQMY